MNIIITDLIKEQTVQCVVMFGAGVVFMLFYQMCSLFSGQMRIPKWIRAGMEILFWFIAAVMVSQFLYYCAHGNPSVHAIAAFAIGVLLWKKFFCGIIFQNNDKKNG